MIISIIIFIVSGLFLAVLLFNKRSESKRGRSMFRIGSERLDRKLASLYARFVAYIKKIDAAYMRNRLHDFAEWSEKIGIIVVEKIVFRFSKVRDLTTGKHLPKNRGSVSFFFKHIEHFKGEMDRADKKIL